MSATRAAFGRLRGVIDGVIELSLY